MISIIVALADGNAIGKNNDLLAYIPSDLKRFKKITTGHSVVMGKKTWESLPKKPLPERRNIVISDNRNDVFEGCEMAYSIEDALKKCSPEDENFIIGGASVYKQFLPFADKLYLTLIHKKFDADVFFPEINYSEWDMISREDIPAAEIADFPYSYVTYIRKKL